MRLSRMRSHPHFRIDERSRHFDSCWELELTPGEETRVHSHEANEELIYLASGSALVMVEETERSLKRGQVVLVPRRRRHKIANPAERTARLISVSSRLKAAEKEASAESLESLDATLNGLPAELERVQAIQAIIGLFDIGGRLTEQIERCVGLDNKLGLEALIALQKRLMGAVVQITERYELGAGGAENTG